MPNVNAQLSLFSGKTTLVMRVRSAGTLINTGGTSMTETGTTGYFTANVPQALSGQYTVDILDGSVVVYSGFLDTRVSFLVDDPGTGAIKTVTDTLSAMIVGNQYTVSALANAPAGGGGGGTIIVSPFVARTDDRSDGYDIVGFVGDTGPISVGIYNADGTAATLAGLTLRLIFRNKRAKIAQIESGSITVNTNTITFSPTAAMVASESDLIKYSLRSVNGGNKVLARGRFLVKYATDVTQ